MVLAIHPLGAQGYDSLVVESAATFASRGIAESSGVVASRQYPGLLWTHNDSGDDANIYATNLQGVGLGRYRLDEVDPVDWEDMAQGPCPDQDAPCLYVADTGDNLEDRREVALYILPEPPPPARRTGRPERLSARMLRVRFPDRAHDVEAIGVTPQGEIYLVTKGRSGPIRVFCIRPDERLAGGTTAVPVGTLDIAPVRRIGQVVTGAAISPSGNRFVIRTYTELFFYGRRPDGSYHPDGRPCWIGYREPQGEGVDFLDEESLVLTSEAIAGHPGTILRVRCIPRERR